MLHFWTKIFPLEEDFLTIFRQRKIMPGGEIASFPPPLLPRLHCMLLCFAYRVCLMSTGGMELKADGSRRRLWNWNRSDHSADDLFPTVYPVVLGVNYNCGIRIFARHKMSLTFAAESCSCRFYVGASVKLNVGTCLLYTSDAADE